MSYEFEFSSIGRHKTKKSRNYQVLPRPKKYKLLIKLHKKKLNHIKKQSVRHITECLESSIFSSGIKITKTKSISKFGVTYQYSKKSQQQQEHIDVSNLPANYENLYTYENPLDLTFLQDYNELLINEFEEYISIQIQLRAPDLFKLFPIDIVWIIGTYYYYPNMKNCEEWSTEFGHESWSQVFVNVEKAKLIDW